MPSGQQVSNEQLAGFLLIAKEYDLNPLTKEIYAFPSNGGIQPIVSIDGWMNLMNSHPQMDGIQHTENFDDDGKCISITCKVFRKDRGHPVEVTEYMAECKRNTQPWNQWPIRMLRHKAAIQAARIAFGFAGIYEPDEVERMPQTQNAANVTQIVQQEMQEAESGEVIDHEPLQETQEFEQVAENANSSDEEALDAPFFKVIYADGSSVDFETMDEAYNELIVSADFPPDREKIVKLNQQLLETLGASGYEMKPLQMEAVYAIR